MNRKSLPLLTGCLILFLAACSTQSVVDPSDLAKKGPYQVLLADAVVVNDPVQGRDVMLRVSYPDGTGPFPVVVFSHGAFCYPQLYAAVTDHWVSHGYVVVLPDHLDSPNNGKLSPDVLPILLSSRIRDMSFVVDALDQIEEQVPGLQGLTDREHTAVAGHSFGGLIATIKSGLPVQDANGETIAGSSDSRFDAAVVMSGVGPTTLIGGTVVSEIAFSSLTGPLFASGGTLDLGNVGTAETFPWEWRMSGYTLAPPDDKYSLVLDNADHYLGGLICRENRGGDPDPEGVEIVRMANTAFLNAYLKDDMASKRFLLTTDFANLTGGRAVLEHK